jgi:hypothetical protein
MFYANVLFHGTSFDPRSLFIRNMTLIISIPSHNKKNKFYFFHLLHTQSQKGKKIENLEIKQCYFLQGYAIRPIKGVQQSLLRGV